MLACRNPDWSTSYSHALSDFRNGDSDSALARAEVGVRQSQNRDPVWNWKFRILQAEVLLRKHAPERSLQLLSPSLPRDLPPDIAIRKDIIQARAFCDSQRVEQGKELLDRTEPLAAKVGQLVQAELEFARGECAFPDQPGLARTYYLKAAELAHGRNGYLEAMARADAGFVLMRAESYDAAVQDFSTALPQTDSPFLKQNILGNLGECYLFLGDWKAAASFLLQAQNIAENVRDVNARDRAVLLIDLAGVQESQLQYGEAKSTYLQALSLANQADDNDLRIRSFDNLADVALRTEDRAGAQDAIAKMEALHPQNDQRLTLLLHKAELSALNHDSGSAETFLKSILAGTSATVHTEWKAESELAEIYVSELRFDDAERMFKQATTTAEDAFSSLGNEQAQLSFLDFERFYDGYVRFLVERHRPLDALNVAERGRSRALAVSLNLEAGHKGLKLHEIQNNLRAKRQIVLAYWLEWNAESYLWVITPSQFKLLKLPSENEIVREVDAYNRDIQEHSAEDSPHGEKLYQMLVAPAERFVPKGSNVIIVPHRRLFKLNFETLVAPSPKLHYWVEDVCIQNTSFLAPLQNPPRASRHFARQMLLMGAPAEASKDFPTLVHAPEELRQVEEHFPRSAEKVISGAAATPAAYDSSDPAEFRFMHFVTHGTASDMNPLDSAIILSPSPEGFKLYARDIIKTRIHPELVTISTCYGAGTRQYSGEGLVGLAWAFMRAGAHQVIGALWEVDDAANAELMDHFYNALAQSGSPAAALHEAKLEMLHSNTFHKRPYYWASLQLYTGR